jgi:hypothetical protein
LILEASTVANRNEFILFGSQAVHAVTSQLPVEVLISRECNIWIENEPSLQQLLKGRLGSESPFRQAKGFYLDPVPPDLPMVPLGWQQRLTELMVDDIKVRCLEIHDLIISKLAAGRLKDYEFIAAVLMARLARTDEVVRRIQTFPDPHTQAVLLARLRIATEAADVAL